MIKKINSILNKQSNIKLIGLFFLVLISALLDLLSISIILPVVSLISSGSNAIDKNFLLRMLSNVFNTKDIDSLFVLTLVLVTLLFLIKSIYSFFYRYSMSKFSLTESRNLTNRLMNTYLGMPYEYHLENNSSTLIRKSIYDVEYFIITITDILDLLVKFLTFIVVFAYLMFVSWSITLILTALLVLFAALIIFVLRPKIRALSKKVQKLNDNNYKYLSQAFEGIKESKVSGTEFNFSKIYDNNRKNINDLGLKKNLINSVPRNTIEFVGILGICLSLYLIKTFGNLGNAEIIETFTVFVYGAVKLLPMIITSTGIINAFSFYRTSVDTIYNDIQKSKEYEKEKIDVNEIKKFPFEKQIEIKNLSFAYRSMPKTFVLKDVNLLIKKNSSLIITGVSGSGKTTLIDIILGLLSPTKGSVLVDGTDISSNLKGWRENISYIPQNIYLSDDSIRKNIAFGIDEKDIDDKKITEALKKAQLYDFVTSLKDGVNTIVGEHGVRLSGGQRQRIGIARAFYRNTNIIVFDEATSSLDVVTEKEIFANVLKLKEDHTVIIISHRESNAKLCDEHYKVVDNKLIKQDK